MTNLSKWVALIPIAAAMGQLACAKDVLKVTIPRHSEMTPVQRLNREGVEAIKAHHYDKAATLFYKAYLYDPADPFTLNNLGYISELRGELEPAQRFYSIAATQGSNANIDRSNLKQFEGKPMQIALQGNLDAPMQVNRINVDAISYLSQNRDSEALAVLRQAQKADPHNAFTLNNLGVSYEGIGNYDDALRSYDAAASLQSTEPVVVSADRHWRGKRVSEMAAASAARLRQRLLKMGDTNANVASVTARGVSAVNENDWLEAKRNFLHAYNLNPSSAFSLNNRGYVAEMDGDLETAQFFYERALKAADAGSRVGLATQRFALGKSLLKVASGSDAQVDGELARYSEKRHQETAPIELTPRGAAASSDPADVPGTPSSPSAELAPEQATPQLQ